MTFFKRQIQKGYQRKKRSFVSSEEGATAVEFALLALPFFALIGAILETALVFLASQIMDAAVDISVREIRTGQAQSASYDADDFRELICDHLYGLFDCSALKISVTTETDFASAALSEPIDEDDGEWTLEENYQPGVGSSIEKVEVYYKWKTRLDFGGFNLATTPDGYRLFGSVRVFRNEPFGG